MSSLEYKRCITKGILTKPQPKRNGRPKSSGDEQTFCAKKRRKGNLSVSNDCKEYGPTFTVDSYCAILSTIQEKRSGTLSNDHMLLNANARSKTQESTKASSGGVVPSSIQS
ncbi:hypothetical protein AVEN_206713-1 [Araneus ventricosus]|uniref:Uncharacterized protein n=1 Tax=Araneus ventricosus TaxID=182803 RepID=A0A4Y2T4X6_ARAVE|nr:hypothetical protein AVEN_206713-1 [Araneus ventricosus]